MGRPSANNVKYVIITAAAGLVILVVVAFAVLAYSCIATLSSFKASPITWPDYCQYDIHVSGLDNYTGGGLTGILVPLPMIDNEPALMPEDDGGYDRNWTTAIVSTDHGKMIALYTNDRNLSNIDTWCGDDISDMNKSFPSGGLLAVALMKRPLYPIASYPDNATSGIHNYTSYVYIDRNMEPKCDNADIIINLNLTLGGTSIEDKYGKPYHAVINETIPADRRGMIPVTVQIFDPAMEGR